MGKLCVVLSCEPKIEIEMHNSVIFSLETTSVIHCVICILGTTSLICTLGTISVICILGAKSVICILGTHCVILILVVLGLVSYPMVNAC
jgi:hypothetical protein